MESRSDDISSIINNADYFPCLCRPDAPIGNGNLLPRGFDVDPQLIPEKLKNIQGICKEAVLLVLKHPSIELTGKYIPRYKTSGASMTIVNSGESINIEFVGPGFDAGELTRGKTVHSSLVIPWCELGEKAAHIIRDSYALGLSYNMSDYDYKISREERIKELLRTGISENDLSSNIPMNVQRCTLDILKKVLIVVEKTIFSETDFGKTYGIIMNFYEDNIYVFEVWQPLRSSQSYA